MGVARKWHFSTYGGAANLGDASGDLFEHRGSGIPLLGITSLNRYFYAKIDWTIYIGTHFVFHKILAQYRKKLQLAPFLHPNFFWFPWRQYFIQYFGCS